MKIFQIFSCILLLSIWGACQTVTPDFVFDIRDYDYEIDDILIDDFSCNVDNKFILLNGKSLYSGKITMKNVDTKIREIVFENGDLVYMQSFDNYGRATGRFEPTMNGLKFSQKNDTLEKTCTWSEFFCESILYNTIEKKAHSCIVRLMLNSKEYVVHTDYGSSNGLSESIEEFAFMREVGRDSYFEVNFIKRHKPKSNKTTYSEQVTLTNIGSRRYYPGEAKIKTSWTYNGDLVASVKLDKYIEKSCTGTMDLHGFADTLDETCMADGLAFMNKRLGNNLTYIELKNRFKGKKNSNFELSKEVSDIKFYFRGPEKIFN